MTSGSEYNSSNKTGAYSSINHKTRLIDSGTAIQAANKVGGGQESYATTTSSGLIKGTDYMLDPSAILWTNKLSNLLWMTKWGSIQPVTSTFGDNAHGIWCGSTVTGTPTVASLDTTSGLAAVYTSGASAGNQAGVNRALQFTVRNFNPSFKLTWKTDEAAANIRFYAGFTGSSSIIGNTDDPLNALNGVGIAMDTTQTNYRIFHNDSAGATISDNTGVAKDTAYHNIELWADSNGNQFYWSLDGSTPVAITTDIPGATASLSCQFTVTAVNADAKPLNVIRSVITSDN